MGISWESPIKGKMGLLGGWVLKRGERTWTLHGGRASMVMKPVLPPTWGPGQEVHTGGVRSGALEWAHLGAGRRLDEGLAAGQKGAHR